MRDSFKVIAASLVTALVIAGCGGAGNEDSVGASADSGEAVESPAVTEDVSAEAEEPQETQEPAPETVAKGKPDRESISFSYLEKYMVEDFYGDGQEYEVYAPAGCDNEDGFLFYEDHGLDFMAYVFDGETKANLYMYLDLVVDGKKEEWENESRYSDIQIGEGIMNGDDRYLFASVQSEDFYGTPFQEKTIFYVEVKEKGVGIVWSLTNREMYMDEETEAVVGEMGLCYGIDLSELGIDGEWADMDQQRKVDEQDVYEPEEGEAELVRVDGYEYLGVVTLDFAEGEVQSPVMAPMGRSVTVRENSLLSGMHGVVVSIGEKKMMGQNFQNNVQRAFDNNYRSESISDYSDNVEKSELMILPGYDEAAYYVLQYDSLDSDGEFKYRKTDLRCYIRLNDEYMLTCNIWLDETRFDSATNAVIRELEKAYGVDMSPYYYKE